MNCVADKHYQVLRHWGNWQPYWKRDDAEPDGDIKALRCAFCDFEVSKRSTAMPKSSTSGLGRYNRMRGYIVAHLHERHLSKLKEAS